MILGKLKFNTKGYDPFIDFIKAYAILWVLVGHFLTHSNAILYPIWGGYEVPLFLTVSCFHFFKKEKPRLNISRIFTRVLFPFVIIQVLIVLLLYSWQNFTGLDKIVGYFFEHGCYGQGDYFPLVYVQIALLLPLSWRCMSKIKDERIIIVAYIAICELLEIISSIAQLPDSLYRILAFRYVFLIYFGWKWATRGIIMDLKTTLLSLISLFSVVYFVWFSGNTEPWFFDTVWKYHRWPCYFYMAELGVFLLNILWRVLHRFSIVNSIISFLSKNSYEIFLAQMIAYVLFPMELFSSFPIPAIGRFITAFVFSILFGQVLHIFFSWVFGIQIRTTTN